MGLFDYKLLGAVLVVLLVLAGVGAGGAYVGWHLRDGQAAREVVALQTAAIKDRDRAIAEERDNSVIDMQAAAEAEHDRMQKRIDAAARDQQLTRELANHAPPVDCVATDTAFRLLCQSAIAAGANPSTDCAAVLPGQMPAASGAGLQVDGGSRAGARWRLSSVHGVFGPAGGVLGMGEAGAGISIKNAINAP